MKVVLFCGGLGTRLREHSDTIPKPLVAIGPRPILWHLMKYYAHFGHKEFILCLGYRGDLIRQYFLEYNPYQSQDFVFEQSGAKLQPDRSDIFDWKITFVDTGLHSNIGERLRRVREHLDGEEIFLANYSDQLSDYPLIDHLSSFRSTDAVAALARVRPAHSFHNVATDEHNLVTGIQPTIESEYWVNGGYFILRQSIFDYLGKDIELVEEPFQRLLARRELMAFRHQGFWKAMDTFKDKIEYERMYARGDRPWVIWD